MIEFLTGSAEYDITAGMRGRMCAALGSDSNKKNIVYIVPEQFEYETERAVYRLMKRKNILPRISEINVTTFSRISEKILSECGESRPKADDVVKNIVMHKAVSECAGSLEVLAGIASKNGFCGKMVKTVSSLKGAGFTARGLEEFGNIIAGSDEFAKKNVLLLKKTSEVARLYYAYESGLSEYLDGADITAPAVELILKNKYSGLDGADIFVDCFNDFTGSQLKLLKALMPRAENMTFGFSTKRNSDNNAFRTANSYISRLADEARAAGCEISFFSGEIPQKYPENSPLREVADKIFSGEKAAVPSGENIELISLPTVYDEADFVASKIIELTEKKGLRYNETAVLCTDFSTYGRYIEGAFRKYGIPMFSDSQEAVITQPMINCVLCTLNAARDFSVENVLSCVKSGFFSRFSEEKNKNEGISNYYANVFEDYIYEWALEECHLKKPFTFGAGSNPHRTKDAESVRKSVAMPLYELSEKVKKAADGAEMTELVYNFLIENVGVERMIFKIESSHETDDDGDVDDIKAAGVTFDAGKTALCQRLWDTLVRIFNALHKELKNVKISIGDYYNIFRDICAGTTLATPPQTVDSVLVGDIDRTRADGVKAAFIVGAGYDAFPTPAPQTGIFSQYETEILSREASRIKEMPDVFSLKSSEEHYRLSLYRAYRALTLPSEYLCVSVPDILPDGEESEKSTVFGELERMFSDLKFRKINELSERYGEEFFCRSIKAAKLRYALRLGDGSHSAALLKRSLADSGEEEFVKRLDEIRKNRRSGSEPINSLHVIPKRFASLLFPTSMGATDAEKMLKCRFGFFCDHGLGVKEKTRREFSRTLRGTAVHFILEKTLSAFGGNIERLCGLSRAELTGICGHFLGEFIKTDTNNDFTEDPRGYFLFGNILNSAVDSLISMQFGFSSGRYRPALFELDMRKNSEIILDRSRITGEPISTVPPACELDPDTADISQAAAYDTILNSLPKTEDTKKIKLYAGPLKLALKNGIPIKLQGIIDRVDMFTENDRTYVRLVDYKSSVKNFNVNNAKNGINIQMLLYLAALLKANEKNSDVKLSAGGIFYIPTKSSGASREEKKPFELLSVTHRESGLIVTDDTTAKDYGEFTKRLVDRVKSESGEKAADEVRKYFELDSANSADPDDFKAICGDVIGNVTDKLDMLFGGDITAQPLVYHERDISKSSGKTVSPCDYCRFTDICGARTPIVIDKK